MMNRFNQVFVMNDNTNLIVFNQPANVQNHFAVDKLSLCLISGYDLFSLVIMKFKRILLFSS
ncbi:MAG: hypothetical protein ACLSA2_08410 [Candidatus Gastranaerophilaceae bacterium]